MPRSPQIYAEMLGKRIQDHGADVWLINTGWSGGAYGTGKRISLAFTRSIVNAILTGSLKSVPTFTDPILGLSIPRACPGLPEGMLIPKQTWKDPAEYDKKSRHLAGMFLENIKAMSLDLPASVLQSGPRLG